MVSLGWPKRHKFLLKFSDRTHRDWSPFGAVVKFVRIQLPRWSFRSKRCSLVSAGHLVSLWNYPLSWTQVRNNVWDCCSPEDRLSIWIIICKLFGISAKLRPYQAQTSCLILQNHNKQREINANNLFWKTYSLFTYYTWYMMVSEM